MAEEISVAGLRARQAVRGARIVAGVQSVAIFLLLVAVAEDYNHNQYFQAWAGREPGRLGVSIERDTRNVLRRNTRSRIS
jgi:hypothetical protein